MRTMELIIYLSSLYREGRQGLIEEEQWMSPLYGVRWDWLRLPTFLVIDNNRTWGFLTLLSLSLRLLLLAIYLQQPSEILRNTLWINIIEFLDKVIYIVLIRHLANRMVRP